MGRKRMNQPDGFITSESDFIIKLVDIWPGIENGVALAARNEHAVAGHFREIKIISCGVSNHIRRYLAVGVNDTHFFAQIFQQFVDPVVQRTGIGAQCPALACRAAFIVFGVGFPDFEAGLIKFFKVKLAFIAFVCCFQLVLQLAVRTVVNWEFGKKLSRSASKSSIVLFASIVPP